MSHHLVQRCVGSLRRRDLHHLDLVELVLADHAARVLAVGAGLGAEAGRVRREPDRQRLGRHDLVAHQVRQRHFAGGDQVEVAAFRVRLLRAALLHLEEVGLELGQLAGAAQARRPDQVGRVALLVAVPRVWVSSMNCASARCSRAMPPFRTTKRAPDSFAAAAKSMPSAAPSSTWSSRRTKRVLGRRSPAPHLDVVGLGLARPAPIRAAGSAATAAARPVRPGWPRAPPKLPAAIAQGGDLRQQGVRILLARLGLADLLGQCIAPRLQLFRAALHRLAPGLEPLEGLQGRTRSRGFAAVGQPRRPRAAIAGCRSCRHDKRSTRRPAGSPAMPDGRPCRSEAKPAAAVKSIIAHFQPGSAGQPRVAVPLAGHQQGTR